MLEIRPANTLTVPSFASRTVNLDVDLGALAIRYVFSTTIADADPGDGKLRLSATQQDAALTIRANTLDVNGADVSGILDSFDDALNATKGHLRLYKVSDPTKWLVFKVTSVAAPAGYRNITVANIAASETSPFADGETVLLSFTPSGDEGEGGIPSDGSVTPPKLDATQAEGLRQVLKDDTFINLRTWYDVEGGFAAGDEAKIQNAFLGAPFRSTLVLPQDTYKTTTALGISRQLSLKLHGSTIRADFAANPGASVIPVEIPANATGGPEDYSPGVNTMVIDGGRIFQNGGGNAVIDFCPAGTPAGAASVFQTIVQNGTYAGYQRTIRFGSNYSPGPPATGNEVAFNTIFNCDMETIGPAGVSVVEFDNTTDGNRLLFSKMAGKGTGALLNVAAGALHTMIMGNALVSSDGATRVSDGSRVMFDLNQCEQYGINGLNPKTHVLVQGLNRIAAGNIFTRNNFGGGLEIAHNMVFYNARGNVIDENQYYPGTVGDIYFGDGGGGLVAKHNFVGPNNWVRGTRPLLDAPTDASRRLKITMDANAQNNRGVWRPSSHLTFANGWTGANVEFFVSGDGFIHFEGDLVGGTTTANTLIMTLPLGCRPRKFISAPVVNVAGAFSVLNFAADGSVYVGTGGLSGCSIGTLSFAVVWLPAEEYDPGP